MMQEHALPVSRTARYFTIGSREDAAEIWFVCHGYGQLAARFLERFQPLVGASRLIVAPEGLSRFYLTDKPTERRVGASWMTREDRLHEIDDYVRYLDSVWSAIAVPKTTITALGFSQGTATVCRWLAFGSSRIDRAIIWGGEVPPDLDLTAQRTVERFRTAQLTLVYGTRDEFFTPKVVGGTEARLREHHVPYQLVAFDGGHEIHEPTLLKLVR
jgi:predicted esterase